jgi:hypothetical protein
MRLLRKIYDWLFPPLCIRCGEIAKTDSCYCCDVCEAMGRRNNRLYGDS